MLFSVHEMSNLFFKDIFVTVVIALMSGLIFGKHFIKFIKVKLSKGQPIREYGPLNHMQKQSTPNMGGFIIFAPVYLIWMIACDWQTTWPLITSLITFNVIGLCDDYLKATRKKVSGLSARTKLITQFSGAVFFVLTMYRYAPSIQNIFVPFYGYVDFGIFGIILAVLTIVATSNAVNLTDGLDGLVTAPLISNTLFFIAIIAAAGSFLAVNNAITHDFITILSAFVGGSLAFLWYNAHPAKIFMGDCGSLASGALLGFVSVLFGLEFILIFSGLIFVIEATSVILQIGYMKLNKGRRLFLMSPIHHHFEQLGINEVTIVIRFWIISIICTAFAFCLYQPM